MFYNQKDSIKIDSTNKASGRILVATENSNEYVDPATITVGNAGVAASLSDPASSVLEVYSTAAAAYISSLAPPLWLKCNEPSGSTELQNSGTLGGSLALTGTYELDGHSVQFGDPAVAGSGGYAEISGVAAPEVTNDLAFCFWIRHTPNADDATGRWGQVFKYVATSGGGTAHGTGYGCNLSNFAGFEYEASGYYSVYKVHASSQHNTRIFPHANELGWQFVSYTSRGTANAWQSGQLNAQSLPGNTTVTPSFAETNGVSPFRVGSGPSAASVSNMLQARIKHLMVFNTETPPSTMAKIFQMTLPEMML